MKQLQPDTIKTCECCKEKKEIKEMHGWTRRQYHPATKNGVSHYTIEMQSRKVTNRLICKKCWPNSLLSRVLKSYAGLAIKEKIHFKSALTFTIEEYETWLLKNGYARMLNKAKKDRVIDPSWGGNPSIDRINSFDGYNLNNMQVLPLGENASKGNIPAIAGKLRTMRFFKLLRKQTGKTKYQMAKHLGMLPQTYFYLEEKARGCSFEILCLIKKKLDLDWNVLGAMIEDEVIITKKDKAKEAKASDSSPS